MLWIDNYKTGLNEIDHQHKQLVNIIYKFKEDISDRTINIDKEMGNIKFSTIYK
jgi:hemerythrin